MRLIRCPRGGKVAAQNHAVRETSGEIVAFSDANAHVGAGRAARSSSATSPTRTSRTSAASSASTTPTARTGRARTGATSSAARGASRSSAPSPAATARSTPCAARTTSTSTRASGTTSSFPYLMVQRGRRAVYEPEAVAFEKPTPDIGDEYRRKVRMFEHCWAIVLRGPDAARPRSRSTSAEIVSHRHLRYASGLLHLVLLAAARRCSRQRHGSTPRALRGPARVSRPRRPRGRGCRATTCSSRGRRSRRSRTISGRACRRSGRRRRERGDADRVASAELACPRDRLALERRRRDGSSAREGHEYPFVDGIPVLVVDDESSRRSPATGRSPSRSSACAREEPPPVRGRRGRPVRRGPDRRHARQPLQAPRRRHAALPDPGLPAAARRTASCCSTSAATGAAGRSRPPGGLPRRSGSTRPSRRSLRGAPHRAASSASRRALRRRRRAAPAVPRRDLRRRLLLRRAPALLEGGRRAPRSARSAACSKPGGTRWVQMPNRSARGTSYHQRASGGSARATPSRCATGARASCARLRGASGRPSSRPTASSRSTPRRRDLDLAAARATARSSARPRRCERALTLPTTSPTASTCARRGGCPEPRAGRRRRGVRARARVARRSPPRRSRSSSRTAARCSTARRAWAKTARSSSC